MKSRPVVKNKALNIIEENIKNTEKTSPCEAAVNVLLRPAAKGWMPNNIYDCEKTMAEMDHLFANADSAAVKKFEKIYLEYAFCINSAATGFAINNFSEPTPEKVALDTAREIDMLAEAASHLPNEKKNPTNFRAMSDNLRFFRSLHFQCLLHGSSQSKENTHAILDEIKGIAKKL